MNCLALALSLVLAASFVHAQTQVLSGPAPAASTLDQQLANEKDVATLQTLLGKFRAADDLAGEGSVWKRLSELRPHVGQYKYELGAVYGRLGQKSLAYTALLELQAQGYAFDAGKDRRFAPIATTEAWDYIVKGLAANREPFGQAKLLHTLPAEDLLLESLAWDPSRKQLLVGSAREGKVFVLDQAGKLKPFVVADEQNGLWAVFDLAADAERGVLWVASTAVPHFKGYDAATDLGQAGIFKFDLKTGKFLKRFLSPSGVDVSFFMSSIALAPDGAVYAADGVNNAVYTVKDDQLRRLFHAPVLGSVRGLAVSGDSRTLYFADHERGLFGFDLASGQPFEVAVPPTLALGGVDGLFWSENRLIAVQSGMTPARIMRLSLAPDGRSIVKVQPLAANQPQLTLPTQGTLAGKQLYVLGNSQKAHYDRFGLPRDRSKLEGVKVVQVDIDWTNTEPTQQPATSSMGGG